MVNECIHQAQKKQKDAYDGKHALSNSYVIDDLVLKKDFKRKKRAGGILDTQYVGPYIITEVHGKGTYRLLLMENKECIVERVSGTHLKPYIAVQSGDEKMLQKREMIAQKRVELECEVIELGKINCSSIWEQLNSSNLL